MKEKQDEKSLSENILSAPESFLTARLVAQRLHAAHLPYLLALQGNPQVMQYMGGARSREAIKVNLEHRLEQWERAGYGTWILLENQHFDFVGLITLRDETVDEKMETVLGYSLVPSMWGKGFATEICKQVIHIAADVLQKEILLAFADIRNRSSHKVLEKVGFHYQSQGVYKNEPHVFYRWFKESLINEH